MSSKLLQESLTVVVYQIWYLFLFLNIIYAPIPCSGAILPKSTASLALNYCRHPVQHLSLKSYLCSCLVFYDLVLCSGQKLYWEELNGCC